MYHSRHLNRDFSLLVLVAFLLGLLSQPADMSAQETAAPSKTDVLQQLTREPISLATWPVWRERLLSWLPQSTEKTQPAFDAAFRFILRQRDARGRLPEPLAKDFFAEFLLAAATLRDLQESNYHTQALLAEKPLRRSIELEDTFARAHRLLALVLFVHRREAEGEEHLEKARQLDPNLPLQAMRAHAAMANEQYAAAAAAYRQALDEEPHVSANAVAIANALVLQVSERQTVDAETALTEIESLQRQFPEEGQLHCMAAVLLLSTGKFHEASQRLALAREAGTNPSEILGVDTVLAIERNAGLHTRTILRYAAYVAMGFAAIYTCVILSMVLAAFALGRFTRGVNAVRLLGIPTLTMQVGQVPRTHGESLLARLYGLALMLGLVMFYLAIPFVVLGLVAATATIVYGILLLPAIPVQLLAIVAVIGLGMAWSVIRSLVAQQQTGGYGLPLDRADQGPLFRTVDEVALAVNTAPIQQIYLSPGAEIGVHQQGRGPFGAFGIRQRVLTLGMASLTHLTNDQLKSVLAHEYAHFSHGDTFYSRFIHQVTMSIEQSLTGMAATGGRLNYVNPFYWFMLWYYKAYTLMAAGFFRSREFLADRMAASLYGRETFREGLLTVASEAIALERVLHEGVLASLQAGQPTSNLYRGSPFPVLNEPPPPTPAELRAQVLEEKGSAFASHPTVAERLEAVADFPNAPTQDATPALDALTGITELEEQLSQFLQQYYLHWFAYQQAQAAGPSS